MRRRLAVACPVVLAVAALLLQGCALRTHFAYTNTTLARPAEMGRAHRDRPDEPELHRPLDRQLVLASEHRQVLADGLRSDRYHGPDLRRQFFRLHENGRRSAHPGP